MRFALRALLLVLAAVAVPACATQKRKNPPVIVFTSPAGGDSNVPRQPIIYIRYDRPLDPSTVSPANFILADSLGTIACTVTYNANLYEVRMIPVGAIGDPVLAVLYQVTTAAGIKSAEGAVVGVNLFFQFTTRSTADATRPTFAGLASIDTPSSQTSLTLNWAVATDTNLQGYNVFMATVSGSEDLTAPDPLSPTTNAPLVFTGLVANTTYFFIVRARDADGNQDTNLIEMSATTLP